MFAALNGKRMRDNMRFQIALISILLLSYHSHADEKLDQAVKNMVDLASKSMQQRANEWLCEPKTAQSCSIEGCKEMKPSVYIKINFSTKTYSRCSAGSCDNYSMISTVGGMYTVIEKQGSGTFVKSLNNGESYVEALATGVGTIQNFGSCKPIG